MKYKKTFAIFLTFLLFSFPLALAQEQTTTEVQQPLPDLSTLDPGTTPDSFLYTFDLYLEGIQLGLADTPEEQLALETAFTTERLAEMNTMIQEQNYEAAQEASEEAQHLLTETQDHIQKLQIPPETDLTALQEGTTSLNTLLETQTTLIQNQHYTEVLRVELGESVQEGALPQEEAATLINDLRDLTVEVQTEAVEQQTELTQELAETTQAPLLEVQTLVKGEEEEQGLHDLYREEVTEQDVTALRNTLQELEIQTQTTQEPAAKTLLDVARTQLEISEQALREGDYGTAFGHFTAAEHLTLNTDRYLSIPPEERAEFRATFADVVTNPDSLREMVERDSLPIVRDWEQHQEDLRTRYPELEERFERQYEQAKRVSEITEKLGTTYGEEYQRLITQEGKTQEEATSVLAERFSDEYLRVYGEPFIPPLFEGIHPEFQDELQPIPLPIPPIGIDDGSVFIPPVNQPSLGPPEKVRGFVEKYDYADPATGYTYTFTDEGYTYTTPAGATYTEPYPKGFDPDTLNSFEEGNEVYTHTLNTPTGTYTYTYTPTGYEVTTPEDATEDHAYPLGTYNILGGGEVAIEPTGYQFTNDQGSSERYEYNPEHENYVSTKGNVYVAPSEGTSLHLERIAYDPSSAQYTAYHREEGGSWTYSPETRTWTSSTGETRTVEATSVAPQGHEGQGSFITGRGEMWNYNPATTSWSSDRGQSYTYHPDTHSWTSPSGQSYTSTGAAAPPGTTASGAGFTGTSGGETWSYDHSTGTWTSSTGQTQTAGGIGSTSGGSWSYDSSTGSWTSPTGETAHTWSGGDTSTWSGGDTSTWSGGDTSTWSGGGDGGGHTGDGGGGGGGDAGGGDGGMGHAVRYVNPYRRI